jgi:hypothetical protein
MSNADLIKRQWAIANHNYCCTTDWLSEVADAAGAAAAALEAHEWRTMDSAPKDGTVVVVVGRYRDATAGGPLHAHFLDGAWRGIGRQLMEPIVAWAWHPRDERWPPEPTPPDTEGEQP